jgi:methylmalonyl-CoA epimerase
MAFKLHHIGIAVDDLGDVRSLLERVFGFMFNQEQNVDSQKVKTTFAMADSVRLELMQATDSRSPLFQMMEHPILSFVKERGNGLHHICLQVEDLEQSLTYLKKKGIRPLIGEIVSGSGGKRVAFLNPNDCNGLLIELTE